MPSNSHQEQELIKNVLKRYAELRALVKKEIPKLTPDEQEALISMLSDQEASGKELRVTGVQTLQDFKREVNGMIDIIESSPLVKLPFFQNLINALANILITLATLGTANVANKLWGNNNSFFFQPLKTPFANKVEVISNDLNRDLDVLISEEINEKSWHRSY